MNTNELIAAIDTEITRLTRIRNLLGETNGVSSAPASSRTLPADSSRPKRPGRPKGSKNKATSFNPEEFAPKQRTMSPAGKERIAAAQRARWAKQKGTDAAKKSRPAAKKVAAKKSSRTNQTAKKTSVPAKKLATSSFQSLHHQLSLQPPKRPSGRRSLLRKRSRSLW